MHFGATVLLRMDFLRGNNMGKIPVRLEQKDKVRRNDIEFDFRDVQTKNPRMVGKTPLYLYTKDPITIHRKRKKGWWEK